jgi:SAM-dependent methyltransferase
MSARTNLHRWALPLHQERLTTAASAYNHAADGYLAYADGDPMRLYAFEGHYAYSDRRVWELIDAKLVAHRSTGARSISILDAGCGPGTWLRRIVARAQALGYTSVKARGFDLSDAQIDLARRFSGDLLNNPGIDLTYEVGDLTKSLPEAAASVELSLCLYGVLNHLPVATVPRAIAEIARVTAGHFITTVRAIGSTPTIFVDALERARDFRQDNDADRCEVELCDGRRLAFDSHLFAATELRKIMAPHFDVEELSGLDLFHTRFAPDPRWNSISCRTNDRFRRELARLEEVYSADPDFIDRATHLLLVARRRLP